jgi:hypothetical protein
LPRRKFKGVSEEIALDAPFLFKSADSVDVIGGRSGFAGANFQSTNSGLL